MIYASVADDPARMPMSVFTVRAFNGFSASITMVFFSVSSVFETGGREG
jgi:hypothetical protein